VSKPHQYQSHSIDGTSPELSDHNHITHFDLFQNYIVSQYPLLPAYKHRPPETVGQYTEGYPILLSTLFL